MVDSTLAAEHLMHEHVLPAHMEAPKSLTTMEKKEMKSLTSTNIKLYEIVNSCERKTS